MARPATLLLWVVALLPPIIALVTQEPLAWRSPAAVLNGLASITGVAGLSFLLVAAILSSRVPGFDRPFGGLTKLWQTHHRLAAVAFLLLLAHPLLVAFATGSASVGVARLFPPWARWEIWAGWGALLVMMVFLAPSFAFFGEPNYQRWKGLHKLAGVAIVLALFHALPLARALPHPWDILIWATLTVLAVGAVTYRWLFSRFQWFGKGGRLRYHVAEVVPVASNVAELNLTADTHQLRYEPGQFVYLTPYDRELAAGFGEEHPFTLSSSPTETGLRLAVKDLGDASRALQQIRPGSPVTVEGPYGAFFKSVGDEASELWVAGGIGITPFLGRARYLRETENEVDVHLIYCVQDESRALFGTEFETLARELPGFHLHMHYFYREGPLTLNFINGCCPKITARTGYICGPPALLSLARKELLAGGMSLGYVHTEEFNLL